MPSIAFSRFLENKKDILMLWHIHAEVAGSTKNRQYRADVLNRTAIIFITACWESYIEDLAEEAFDFLIDNAQTPDIIPTKVRTIAAREIREDKDERRIWELAGNGWQKIMHNHKHIVRNNWLRDFNTPKSRQVCDLFAGLLGISDITSAWTWNGMSSEDARQVLDQYVTVRGNIAHRIRHDETVHKHWSKSYLGHVAILVEKSENAVQEHLLRLTSIQPW